MRVSSSHGVARCGDSTIRNSRLISAMKRSGPLKRSTELKRNTPLRSQSKKRVKEQRQRRQLVRTQLEQRPYCEASQRIAQIDRKHICSRQSVDIHEPKMRSRGGSFLDVDNTISVCRACHDWIHANPASAEMTGLLKHSWSD